MAETRGGSGPVRRAQLSYLVIRNVKTTSHFLKVTPLIWAIEGQNTEWETDKGPNFRGGLGGVRKVSANGPNLPLFFYEASPKDIFMIREIVKRGENDDLSCRFKNINTKTYIGNDPNSFLLPTNFMHNNYHFRYQIRRYHFSKHKFGLTK